jgi:hypothetical protein
MDKHGCFNYKTVLASIGSFFAVYALSDGTSYFRLWIMPGDTGNLDYISRFVTFIYMPL